MKAALVFMLVSTQIGCAQVMVIRQPAPLNRDVLLNGAERSRIIGGLGRPMATEKDEEGKRITDTYGYTDGGKVNSFGGKMARLVLYTAGDVLTIFLTQILWMPAEMLLDGTDYTAVVDYERRRDDKRWIATQINEFKRKR